jgi:neutral amino acid transport system permease protein
VDTRSRRRGTAAALIATFIAVLAGVLIAGATGSARAAGGEINGTMTTPDGQPIAGVQFQVSNAKGFTGSATSGKDGKWVVAIPGPGQYTVTIVPATLPSGVSLTNPDKTQLTVTLLSTTKTVSFPTGAASNEVESKWDRLQQLTVDGLAFGLVIALAGVGLSMIFGTTGLTNFAHGELITLGAIGTLVFNNFLGLPFVLAAAMSLICCALFGALQDLGLWRQLRHKGVSLIAMLVVSIGFGILLRYIYLFFMGGETQQYASYSGQAGLTFGPVDITPKVVIGSVVAILALLATLAWLGLTRTGKASRAISDNPALASASGIHVERVINLVWTVGAALAGLAGIIYSMSVGVNWLEGFQMLLLVFASVILGGLGTAVGALVGALVVGVLIQVSTLIIPTEMKTVGALVIMIIILLIRPQGILGRAERVG